MLCFGMLTDGQIETYRRDGYLVIPRLIRGEQLAELRPLTARIVADARGIDKSDDLYDLEPSHRAAWPRVRRLKPTLSKRYEFFHKLVRDPVITSIVAQLLGPAIRQHGGKLNMKSAGYGSPVEWHQDWAFYPHTNDEVLATDEFNSRMVLGEPAIEPRIVPAPVRMPLPAAGHQGSIYENQRGAGRRFFETPVQLAVEHAHVR